MGEHRCDTRTRIKAVALELFAEHGYDKTALREIAERLQVTKAALYYHFKTKEDIVVGVFDDAFTDLDELIAWGRAQPPTRATREELIRRYADLVYGRLATLMRFAHENQVTMRDLAVGARLKERIRSLAALLADRDAPPADQLRSTMALITLQVSLFVISGPAVTEEERRAAALTVALELVAGPTAPTGSDAVRTR